MNPTIRLVCSECLRSVEQSGDFRDGEAIPTTCASCGGEIEERPSDPGESTGDTAPVLSLDLSPEDTIIRPFTPPPPSTGCVDRFQLRESLGGGGFGNVFRAYDPRLERDVALKILKPTKVGSRSMERFFREARAAAQLDHPNIVALYDAGRDAGQCWIAYQFVAGQTLSRLCDLQPISHETAARIAWELAGALDHAHQRGVFHRDIKPANVIIEPSGRPRLTDFGLARRADFDSTLTREGTILGTPAYMSPEQAAGNSHLADARSDVYSLGVMFHEMLCGKRPSNRLSGVPLWQSELTPPPAAAPRSSDRAIPRELDRICRKTLAHNPDERYPDARSLADDLDRWLRRGKLARPRRRLLGVVVAALLLILAPGLVFLGVQYAHKATKDPVAPFATERTNTKADQTNPIDPVVSTAEKRPVVGNRGHRKIYHLPECPDLKMMLPKNRVDFPDAAEAQQQGFKPCSHCHPPQPLGPKVD